MRAVHRVLKGLCWSDCLVYLDDVMIFNRTLEEHRDRLTVVLSRLAGAGLKINPKKCKLLADKVTVLGHNVSREGISTDPEKVRVVQEWPAPSNISQLRSFLGTAGYYHHFVPKYADLAAPLYRMEQKGKNWEWTQGCHEAFLNIKRQLANALILAFHRLDTLFILDPNASDSGIGAVLSQLQDGRERVIAYAAWGLSKSERNYSTTRKELLAGGAAHFEAYLCGKTFVARTNHKALRWLKNFRNPKGQIARWLNALVTLISKWNTGLVVLMEMPMGSPAYPGTMRWLLCILLKHIAFQETKSKLNRNGTLYLAKGGGENCYLIGHNGTVWPTKTNSSGDVGRRKELTMYSVSSYASLGNWHA